ncbi:MAG: peptidoglycan-binding protein, partial [Actinomycetota bacterium]|nr:peptidoglycan-binding protein [Actinomycetota bacterium]
LQAAPAVALTGTALPQASVPVATRYYFKFGSRGRTVKKVQRKLRVTPVSGYYGPKTKAAVKRYQRRHHLRATGALDARTMRGLRIAVPRAAARATTRAGFNYGLGRVRSHVARAAYDIGPRFGLRRVGGYRRSAVDRNGHPAGRALDFMVRGSKGDRVARYVKSHAKQYRVEYIIWDRKIWSVARKAEGWRRYRGPNPHTDHVHVNFLR